MKKVHMEVDGRTIEAEEGMTLLQAIRQGGIEIPTLCYNEKLAPYGACRLCTVEISSNGKTRLVASCVYPVENGLVIKTESEKVIKIRRLILELLLPHSPTGPLEKLAKKYDAKKSRFQAEYTSCILCGLCVRYCAEIKKANAVCFVGRGTERDIAFVPEIASKMCPGCRECFPLCPSGKITKEGIDISHFSPINDRK